MMRLLIGSIGWLALCAVALWWALPRLDAADKELDHEEAIDEDRRWEWRRTSTGWEASVPPILNQSERWLTNAREAESADDDWDRGDAA